MATVRGPWQGDAPAPLPDRLPPHNPQAEVGVLGSVFLDPAQLKAVRAVVRGPEDFFCSRHQAIYQTLVEIEDAGKAVDTLVLADELQRKGRLIDAGGLETLAEIADQVPHSANASLYAGLVRECAEARDLIEFASEVLRDAYSRNHTSAELVTLARKRLTSIESEVHEHGWQEPELDDGFPVLPFPMEALPFGMARFVEEVSRSVPCPPDFVAVPALAVLGVAAGRSVALRVKNGWYEEGNLWTAIVGPPGTGKTPPLKAVARPLYRIFEEELEVHQQALAMVKAARREAKAKLGKGGAAFDDDEPAPLKRVLVGDSTAEALGLRLRDNPRGLIMVLDELAGMINGLNQYKQAGGNDTEFYLSLWSRASFPIDRKGQEGGIPIYVRSPFFGMTGGIQPDKLNTIGTTKDGRRLNDGFLDRFLMAWPKEVATRWTEEAVEPETEAEWSDAVRRLWARPMTQCPDGYGRPWAVDFTPEAKARYAAWFDENCASTRETDFPDEMRGPYSKIRAYCARIALVLEQAWWAFDPGQGHGGDPPPVGLRSVQGAIRLTEYFESHYRKVIAFVSGTEAENPDARAILEWIRKREARSNRFSAKEPKDALRRKFEGRPPEAFQAALAWLEVRGIIRRLPDPPRPLGGRTPKYATYEINPSLSWGARETRETRIV